MLNYSQLPDPILEAFECVAYAIYGDFWYKAEEVEIVLDISQDEMSEIFTDEEATKYVRFCNYVEDMGYAEKGVPFVTVRT